MEKIKLFIKRILHNSQITLIIILGATLFVKAMVGHPALVLSWAMFWLAISLLMQKLSGKL